MLDYAISRLSKAETESLVEELIDRLNEMSPDADFEPSRDELAAAALRMTVRG
jgi:hypothetical protein